MMNVYDQITNDFIFLLELCKQPKDVFATNTREYVLAQTWMDKLCRLQCMDMDERRLRNIYMSRFVASLNGGALRPPFNAEPPSGKLRRYNFDRGCEIIKRQTDFDMNKQKDMNKQSELSIGSETSERSFTRTTTKRKGLKNVTSTEQVTITIEKKSIEQKNGKKEVIEEKSLTAQTSQTSNISKKQTAADKRRNRRRGKSPNNDNDIDNDTSKIDPSQNYIVNYMTHKVNMPSDCFTELTGLSNALKSTNSYGGPPEASHSEYINMRIDIKHLLESISSELRGDIEPGDNDYLERELARYKSFIMNFSKMASSLERMNTQATLRSYLLLNLQNDLIKLLKDANI